MIDLKKIEENIDILIAIETKEDLLEWIRKNDEQRDKVKNYSIPDVSQQSELLAFEQWVDKNTTTALKDGIKLALENYKKANCG